MRAIVKTTLIILWILACALFVAVLNRLRAEHAKWWMVRACYGGIARIIGIRVNVIGEVSEQRPLLLVTNHSTYLDIVVLGASLPVRFCPKSEIAGWPLISIMCKITGCVFIDRRPSQTKANREALHKALSEQGLVCLFPEGTTGNGKRVLPFRSSYFSLAEEQFAGRPLLVQPAAIVYTHICNMPIDSAQRSKIAWYGDMALAPHAAELFRLGPIRAELRFFPPVDIRQFADRKALAAHCQNLISGAISGGQAAVKPA